jgi:serine phosphatase RsbU (regulator of sigma subunit)
MFFKRRKPKSPPLPDPLQDPETGPVTDLPPAEGEALSDESGTISTMFLTGDSGRDRSRVELLLGAIAGVSESRDLEPLLTDIVDRSVEVTGAERGLLLMRGEDGTLEPRVARGRGGVDVAGFAPGDPKASAQQLRFSTSIARRVLDTGQALRATVSSDSEALELGRSVFDLKLRAAMCVPLASGREAVGEPLGVLYVDSRAATRQFSQSDLSFFAALAQHISIALENARLHLDSLEKLRLEQSLELASAIQRDLMPELPEKSGGFALGGFFRPAERAGGDFYDVHSLKGGRLSLVVGDVSGHGIGPALITAAAQAGLRSYMRVVPGTAPVVTLLNQDLSERMEDGRFVTMLVGLFDESGHFEIVNAGHADPMIWRAASETVEVLSEKTGARRELALGMIDDHEYEVTATGELGPGDIMVLYSDGLTEARDLEQPEVLFGEDGLATELERLARAHAGPREIAAEIAKAALLLSKDSREDDMTLLVIQRAS